MPPDVGPSSLPAPIIPPAASSLANGLAQRPHTSNRHLEQRCLFLDDLPLLLRELRDLVLTSHDRAHLQRLPQILLQEKQRKVNIYTVLQCQIGANLFDSQCAQVRQVLLHSCFILELPTLRVRNLWQLPVYLQT